MYKFFFPFIFLIGTCHLLAEPFYFGAIKRTQGESLGEVSSYTTLEGMSFPYRYQNISPFGDLRLHYLDDENFASNLGVGCRFLSESSSLIFGINAYYDYRHFHHSHFNQCGLGFEILGRQWNLRLNGYLPVGRKKKLLSHCHFSYLGGYFIERKRYVESLRGANVEIERLFFQRPSIDLYMALGGYYYYGIQCKHHGNLFGVEYRLSINPNRPLSLSLSVTHDPTFQTKVFGQLTWSFPAKRTDWERERFQPVRRHEIIAADKKCKWKFNY